MKVGSSKMFRRKYSHLMLFARRRKMPLIIITTSLLLCALLVFRWVFCTGSRALTIPAPEVDLNSLRRSRLLKSYIDDIIEPLIEPTSSPCYHLQEVPVIVLVTSAPSRFKNRDAIRETWAKEQPTFFFLGLHESKIDENLVDNYIEAKQYGDLIVFEFQDSYSNLTLKTALMMSWSSRRCPQAQFVFKTDDDVMVNPRVLKEVVNDNSGAQLVGYRLTDGYPHRDVYNKWYLPRWLYPREVIPEYLSGTGYLINGDYLTKIYEAAHKVPLINLEDVYFTYLVAKEALGLNLTHDRRLSPYQPWLPISCTYHNFASMHSIPPERMANIWSKLEYLSEENLAGKKVCVLYSTFLNFMSNDLFLY